jgi:glycosyltransferase involved in cell wall biosynthesis
MLVRAKQSKDKTVIDSQYLLTKLGPRANSIPLTGYGNRHHSMFSAQWFPDALVQQVNDLNPDIVHLHWVCNGFLKIESLPQLKKPIVWTFHDMWSFTGGCHYSLECDRYTNCCGSCPQLGSKRNWDLSRWVWNRKAHSWKNLDLTIVTPSEWLAKCAQASSLFQGYRVEVIANGLDTQVYKPIDRASAREILNLPQDKKIILFGAGSSSSDPRKGFNFLLMALEKLAQQDGNDRLELAIFGDSSSHSEFPAKLKVHHLGQLNDDLSLAISYSAADIFVAPSIQDNLPNTVMEALACGTPCVAFNLGGMPDMIQHQSNGYLSKTFEVEDLVKGIEWVLAEQHHPLLSANARETVLRKFNFINQAKQFSYLYERIRVRSCSGINHIS